MVQIAGSTKQLKCKPIFVLNLQSNKFNICSHNIKTIFLFYFPLKRPPPLCPPLLGLLYYFYTLILISIKFKYLSIY